MSKEVIYDLLKIYGNVLRSSQFIKHDFDKFILYIVENTTMLAYNLLKGKSLNEFINKGNNAK